MFEECWKGALKKDSVWYRFQITHRKTTSAVIFGEFAPGRRPVGSIFWLYDRSEWGSNRCSGSLRLLD
eukprot:3872472-Rhodomonas_salina.2